jgi:hypothetical protein
MLCQLCNHRKLTEHEDFEKKVVSIDKLSSTARFYSPPEVIMVV